MNEDMQNGKHGMLRFNVYNRLRDDILNQVYKKGEALTESKLTNDLGVSRTPVREAFVQLQIDGLVDAIPNKGVVVRGLNIVDIQDMYDIRAFIEGIAAKRACENMSDVKLKELEKQLLMEEEFTKHKDFQGFQLSDTDFHDIISKSSNSKIFENMLLSMIQYTRIARTQSLSTGERAQNALNEHYAIYKAMKERESIKAKELMERHVGNAKKSFIKTLIEKENKNDG
ncbi:MAG: GntR family transcriptional regulator [Saccharofermentanales bacterium]